MASSRQYVVLVKDVALWIYRYFIEVNFVVDMEAGAPSAVPHGRNHLAAFYLIALFF